MERHFEASDERIEELLNEATNVQRASLAAEGLELSIEVDRRHGGWRIVDYSSGTRSGFRSKRFHNAADIVAELRARLHGTNATGAQFDELLAEAIELGSIQKARFAAESLGLGLERDSRWNGYRLVDSTSGTRNKLYRSIDDIVAELKHDAASVFFNRRCEAATNWRILEWTLLQKELRHSNGWQRLALQIMCTVRWGG